MSNEMRSEIIEVTPALAQKWLDPITKRSKNFIYTATDYPNIFKKVYWGHATHVDIEIAINRNEFIKKYNVQKVIYPSFNMNGGLNNVYFCLHFGLHIDHLEYYRTKDGGAIILNSPYSYGENKLLMKRMFRLGFDEIDKLYCSSATTFIKFFQSVRDMNRWLKTIPLEHFDDDLYDRQIN